MSLKKDKNAKDPMLHSNAGKSPHRQEAARTNAAVAQKLKHARETGVQWGRLQERFNDLDRKYAQWEVACQENLSVDAEVRYRTSYNWILCDLLRQCPKFPMGDLPSDESLAFVDAVQELREMIRSAGTGGYRDQNLTEDLAALARKPTGDRKPLWEVDPHVLRAAVEGRERLDYSKAEWVGMLAILLKINHDKIATGEKDRWQKLNQLQRELTRDRRQLWKEACALFSLGV